MNLLARFSWWRLGRTRGLSLFVRKHLRGEGCAGDYRFKFRSGGRGYLPFSGNSIFCDARFTIVLTRRAFPFRQHLACIGFDVSEPGVIEVKQIQGVRGKQDELRALRWDRMLLEILTTLARDSAFQEVRVQAAHRNHWLAGRNHLRYDVLPKRMGFEAGEDYHTLRFGA